MMQRMRQLFSGLRYVHKTVQGLPRPNLDGYTAIAPLPLPAAPPTALLDVWDVEMAVDKAAAMLSADPMLWSQVAGLYLDALLLPSFPYDRTSQLSPAEAKQEHDSQDWSAPLDVLAANPLTRLRQTRAGGRIRRMGKRGHARRALAPTD